MTRRGIALASDLTLPLEAVTETFAILANRGSGKSVTAQRLVEQLHHAGLPVVVLDVKGDWWGIRSSADGAGPGLPFVIFGGDHADVPLEATAGELLADLIVDDRIPAVLDLSLMSKAKARTFATVFAERLYERNRDALHVVIEEADVLIPQRATAETARLLGAMEDLAKRGRSRGLGLTVVSQRPQEVAKSVLELMETVILLRMTGPRSIKAAADWISVNATDDGAEARTVITSLPGLQTGEAWVWSPAFLRLLQRVRITMSDTFDSHATPTPGHTRAVPKTRADIDLEALGAEIAATVERAKDADPRRLRAQLAELRSELSAAQRQTQQRAGQAEQLAAQLVDRDAEIAALRRRVEQAESRPVVVPAEVLDSLSAAARVVDEAVAALSPTTDRAPDVEPVPATRPASEQPTAVAAPAPVAAPPVRTRSPRPGAEASAVPAGGFRKGAQRMLESLGRMAPLHLTRAQWGTVAKIKSTSGTFSTYLGELRRAGLIEEDAAGFTLTDAGFDYLGGRPAPMTAAELQQYYLSMLRAGAARMLTAVMQAYPGGLTREEISAAAGVTASSGTFSTYLGELRRNGLIEQRGAQFVAREILMHGAASAQRSGR
ncbi:DUF853 family protein (plasmid) [Mycolicibacterium vanbaalenii]|uniref:ATP-binding protein n=1 Tax=Mycolicibacterium vanbaalenii TaxID=110539 RepID=UPI001F26985E|nr:helicase HerA-like domain-containing protein [Mycolicibacterium vanbaalenii]UJL32261.1 DUF853 family protein [Mycolicibacterium vanbaalenii]WND60175.1 DUF853 family protein [Mycolicibacterium vanbaalenii]